MTLTRLPGIPDRDQAKIGMAYFAGTGPAGKTCGSCEHRRFHGGCAVYAKQKGVAFGPRVALKWKACKFYEVQYRMQYHGQA